MFYNMLLLKKNKNSLGWFQKLVWGQHKLHKVWWLANCSLNYVVDLVDCWIVVDWLNENNPDALFSSTNRASYDIRLLLFCSAPATEREKRERKSARARKGMLLFSPSKSNSYAVVLLLLFALVILEMNCFLCRQENAGLY